MARNHRLASPSESDPREHHGAEVIDLATRSVIPMVARQRRAGEGLGLAAGVAAVGLLGALTFWGMNQARQAKPASPHPAPSAAAAVPPAIPAQAITIASPAPAPSLAPQVAPQAATVAQSAPAVIFDNSAPVAPQAAPAVPAATPPAAASAATGDDFASRVGGVGGSAAVAAPAINPATTVTQGTLIPAVLETAIDTDVPGYVRAVVSADVRGFDGSHILVPRSSRLIGQYKSGLQAGQKRAYVIWTRLIRPDGVSVAIASPAVSFGGEAGLEGKVNSHFFQRFGSAILLSVIGSLSTVATGGTSVVIGGGQSAAAAAVGQTGQISPTVRVRQGEPIRVFTARDLDFSKVTPE